jgi:hypothetical protein
LDACLGRLVVGQVEQRERGQPGEDDAEREKYPRTWIGQMSSFSTFVGGEYMDAAKCDPEQVTDYLTDATHPCLAEPIRRFGDPA